MKRKHKWVAAGGNTYQCSVCKTLDDIQAGLFDTIGQAQELERIINRDDCPGRQRKATGVKRIYTREELTLHDGFVWTCALCRAVGLTHETIMHSGRCVFHIFGVTEVTIKK